MLHIAASGSALLECASLAHDLQKLRSLLRSTDGDRLLVLAEEHGVIGQLADVCASSMRFRSSGNQAGSRRSPARTDFFFSLRLTAELFGLLGLFSSQGIGPLW